MNKVNGIILALGLMAALCGTASATQLYVNENGWWRDGGAFNTSSTPIQSAVNAAAVGNTIYVYNGSYTENVNVNKRLTLEGEGADVVTVTAATSSTVFEVTANYVNISGFAARGATDASTAGISFSNVDYCNISRNNLYGNRIGILMWYSSNNTLEGNIANLNNENGIYLRDSSNNTLKSNTANYNRYNGIRIDGGYPHEDSNNNLMNNTANSNTQDGIYLYHSCNNTLDNNNCSNNRYGFWLRDSSNHNTLTNNTANYNNQYGIYPYNADNNNIVCNCVQNNTQHGFGLYNADDNNITCNWVQGNAQRGFYITGGSTGNNISCNNIIENGNYNAASGGWEWQFYMDQYNPVEAKHNYWGVGMNNVTIDASIYDDEEGGWGEVEFYPFETGPVPCAPVPELPTVALFAVGLIVLAGYARRR